MTTIPFRKKLVAAMLLATVAVSPLAVTESVAQEAPVNALVGETVNLPAIGLAVGQSVPLDLSSIGAVNKVFPGNRTLIDVFQETRSGELFLRGKKVGTSELMIWAASRKRYRIPVTVTLDAAGLQAEVTRLLPQEKDVRVTAVADSIVLSGSVADGPTVKQIVAVAEAYVRSLDQELVGDAKVYEAPENETGTTIKVKGGGGGSVVTPENQQSAALGANRVINLLQVRGAQQVMLEVKIAEVSKTLLNRMGAEFTGSTANGSWTYGIASKMLSGAVASDNALLTALKTNGTSIKVDAQKKDELVKILAEPTIVAISGQEGSFLSGGKIYIPTGRDINGTVTLEEKEYGVGLRFLPTVLSNGLVDLQVTPEVSELAKDGSAFTVGGITSVFPSVTTRRASTVVQLRDGETFVIAGLLKNNVIETVKRVPLLGDIPLLGMLFRHNEYQKDQTELLFLVTPRLVKPVTGAVKLPTDNFKEPSQFNFMLNGRMEGFHTSDDEKKAEKEEGKSSSTITKPAGDKK
ncbi:MAG TPA: type II and III secretion system protein family protein [Moraxellaceae bacterium]|nr:type II and III secretion system protein family protein [Moraxellaceae bacterium]